MQSSPSSRVLVLVIEPEAEPIEGTVTDEAGQPYPFLGWLGLARAMERVLGDGPPALGGGHQKSGGIHS